MFARFPVVSLRFIRSKPYASDFGLAHRHEIRLFFNGLDKAGEEGRREAGSQSCEREEARSVGGQVDPAEAVQKYQRISEPYNWYRGDAGFSRPCMGQFAEMPKTSWIGQSSEPLLRWLAHGLRA